MQNDYHEVSEAEFDKITKTTKEQINGREVALIIDIFRPIGGVSGTPFRMWSAKGIETDLRYKIDTISDLTMFSIRHQFVDGMYRGTLPVVMKLTLTVNGRNMGSFRTINVSLAKDEDDWWWVVRTTETKRGFGTESTDKAYYKCDQVQGLISCLRDIFL
jgi:hypothetical protein